MARINRRDLGGGCGVTTGEVQVSGVIAALGAGGHPIFVADRPYRLISAQLVPHTGNTGVLSFKKAASIPTVVPFSSGTALTSPSTFSLTTANTRTILTLSIVEAVLRLVDGDRLALGLLSGTSPVDIGGTIRLMPIKSELLTLLE